MRATDCENPDLVEASCLASGISFACWQVEPCTLCKSWLFGFWQARGDGSNGELALRQLYRDMVLVTVTCQCGVETASIETLFTNE